MTRICSQIIFLLFSFPLCLVAQAGRTDSLLNQIKQHKTQDTVLVNLLSQYAYSIANTNHTKAFQKATEAYALAHQLNYESGIALTRARLLTRVNTDNEHDFGRQELLHSNGLRYIDKVITFVCADDGEKTTSIQLTSTLLGTI